MAYSKKLETYISVEELEHIYSRYRVDSEDVAEDMIWHRIMKRYPNAGQKVWDEIYSVVTNQLRYDYDIKVTATIKRKERNE